MLNFTLFWPLLKREARALWAHPAFAGGGALALLAGVVIALSADDPQARIWMLFQILYYLVPLIALLSSVMLVRQDLREAPLLALLPGSSLARVLAKTTIAVGYLWGLLACLLVPVGVGEDVGKYLLLGAGAACVAMISTSLGVWQAFRGKSEVRAYFGALGCWCLLVFGSGALAYAAHLWLPAPATPLATLLTLMSNPVESFRIFVFFALNAVPMNPQTTNVVALWWLSHPLVWLVVISMIFTFLPLTRAMAGLRFRAHTSE